MSRLIRRRVLPLSLLALVLAAGHVRTLRVERNRVAARRVHEVATAVDRRRLCAGVSEGARTMGQLIDDVLAGRANVAA